MILVLFILYFQDNPLKENFSTQISKGNLLLLEEVMEPLSPRMMLKWMWSSPSSELGWTIRGKAEYAGRPSVKILLAARKTQELFSESSYNYIYIYSGQLVRKQIPNL